MVELSGVDTVSLSPSRKKLRSFGTRGSGHGEFGYPRGVVG